MDNLYMLMFNLMFCVGVCIFLVTPPGEPKEDEASSTVSGIILFIMSVVSFVSIRYIPYDIYLMICDYAFFWSYECIADMFIWAFFFYMMLAIPTAITLGNFILTILKRRD